MGPSVSSDQRAMQELCPIQLITESAKSESECAQILGTCDQITRNDPYEQFKKDLGLDIHSWMACHTAT